MHACTSADAQSPSALAQGRTMADWSMMDREWLPDGTYDPYSYGLSEFYQQKPPLPPPSVIYPPRTQQFAAPQHQPELHSPLPVPVFTEYAPVVPRGDNPREIRNKAEKQRRDKLNHSISELASMVPPVVAANKKIDKTGVLRLTAHYLRSHQYVFGDSIDRAGQAFTPGSAPALLSLLGGFLLTTTYKGLVVVVSQNIQKYLGHAELDLLGQNIFNYIHPDDHQTMKDNLMPRSSQLGPSGELLMSDDSSSKQAVAAALADEKRRFIVRFKKHGQRSEPASYLQCYVEGTLRKSDKASRVANRCCQVVRRARARGENPCSSGNDIVFIGMVRPDTETFLTEKRLEAFRMEYRTRHSIDGQIMECEQRISLVAGYMTHEVNGVNAMTFMHRDDVRWVIFSLREMYDQHRLVGESCYRLLTKTGQFIYLKTRGILDVDEDSRAVRSFVCTNTVVDEREGKHLIEMMKKRCMMMVAKQNLTTSEIEDIRRGVKNTATSDEDEILPVPDLEKVILHLVTDLPSPVDSRGVSPDCGDSPSLPLAIIPPQKEKILSAIEKIYSVTKTGSTDTTMFRNAYHRLKAEDPSRPTPLSLSPVQLRLAHQTRNNATLRRRLEEIADPESMPGPDENCQDNSPLINFGPINGDGAFVMRPEAIALSLSEPAVGTLIEFNVSDDDACMNMEPSTSSPTSRKRGKPTSNSNNKKLNKGPETFADFSRAVFEAVPLPPTIQETPEDLIPLMGPFEAEVRVPPDRGYLHTDSNIEMIDSSFFYSWTDEDNK